MIIERTCPFTGKVNSMDIEVTDEQLELWHSGTLIQDAMPHLSTDEREFLISGITPEVWNDTIGADDTP